ncbi:hypothetical protein SAMN05216404_101456 [Nitrosospira multiformis]|uniref:Uncharacterized protein n=1 Tax=Nitrosospira multiformis TaxID=1231 RepID=A0A1H8C687_9PROT|nr:hypothetical protein SAMN05216404_101456 [Nitrosospira multiformis]
MNRTWLANIGSGYFHQSWTCTVLRRAECWTVAARHAYPQKQSGRHFHELIFILREPFQTPGFLEVPI